MKDEIEVVGEDRRGKAPGPRNMTATDEADIREFVRVYVKSEIEAERTRMREAYAKYVCAHGPPYWQDEWNALMDALFPTEEGACRT